MCYNTLMKKRLKIGIFLDNYYPSIDGVVLVVDNLAKELSKFNDVTVVVPYTLSMSEDKNRTYEVKRIRSYKIPFSEYRLSEVKSKHSKAYKYLINKKFDIIHIHSPFFIGELGVRIARDCKIPCVCTMHTRFDFEIRKKNNNKVIVNRIIDRLMKVYNNCDGAIAINNAMVRVFRDFGCILNPVIIYNGTDLKKVSNEKKAISLVNKMFNIDKDELVFLFVGRIIEIKNIFFILDNLKKLKEDNVKFKMIYVGDGTDLNKLKNKVKEYKMEDDVIFTGKINDRNLLSSIYFRSDLFLFPSLFDASSLVQIEAAVNHTPGLFIEGSVTADTIINNVNGFTSKNDVVSYKNKIKKIISDKDALKKVGDNAAKMLGKSWSDLAIETYNYYLELIERNDYF